VTLASALSMPLHYNVDKLSEIDKHCQAETLNETLTTLSGVGTSSYSTDTDVREITLDV